MVRIGARRGLWAVGILALVLRLVVIATSAYVPRSDAADYDRIAVALVRQHSFPPSLLAPGGGPSAFRSPMFPLALAGVDTLAGVDSPDARWQAGRIAEALLGVLTVALVYLIAARLAGPGLGLLAGTLAAAWPPLLLVGSSLMSEPLFIALVLATTWAALRSRASEHRYRWVGLAGVLLGLAALTRGNGIVLLVPLAFLVWSERPRRSWRSWRSPALVVAAAVLTLVPWALRNAQTVRAFVPISTETGYALAGTYNAYAQQRTDFPAMWLPPVLAQQQALAQHPGLNEAEISTTLTSTALSYLGRHSTYLLKVAYWNGLRVADLSGERVERWAAQYEGYPRFLLDLSFYSFWVLGLLALVGAATRAARRLPLALWGVPLAILLPALFVQGLIRYRSPADPFLLILAAFALQAAWRRWMPAGAGGGGATSPGVPVASRAA